MELGRISIKIIPPLFSEIPANALLVGYFYNLKTVGYYVLTFSNLNSVASIIKSVIA